MREVTAGREIERGSGQGPSQAEPARVVSRALGPGRPPRFPAEQPRGHLGHTHRGTQEPPRRGAGTGRRSQAAARRRGRGATDRAGLEDHRGSRWRLRGRGSRAASWLIAAPGRAARGRPAGTRDCTADERSASRRPCAHGGAAGHSGSGRVGMVGGSAGSRGSRPDARSSHSEPPRPAAPPSLRRGLQPG